jgi:hypothetical protein
MRLLLRSAAIALGAILLLGIGWVALGFLQLPNPRTTLVTLKSGRHVDVIWSGVVSRPTPTWVFEYRTRIAFADLKRLRHEAEAIWPDIREQADRAGQSKASLCPINFSRELRFSGWRPVVIGQRMTSVSFEKIAGGTWKVSNPLPLGYRNDQPAE